MTAPEPTEADGEQQDKIVGGQKGGDAGLSG
jgi:hypothetical protein